MTIKMECPYDPPHSHEFDDDWEFGGANNQDPRCDSRWTPTTYVYLDDHFNRVWLTQTPLCLDQALDEFTLQAPYGAKYLQAGPNSNELQLVEFEYDADTDMVFPLGESANG